MRLIPSFTLFALVAALPACGGDPQADLARLCAAAEEACPEGRCPAGAELEPAWRRALAKVAMDTPVGREVRTAAYSAAVTRVDAAARDASVAAGLTWDCAALARLEAAAVASGVPSTPLAASEPGAASMPAPDPAPAPGPAPGFAEAFAGASAIFADTTDRDEVLTALARYVSRGEATFGPIAAAAAGPADAARDAEDAEAALALGKHLATFCDLAGTKCGAAAQAAVTLLSRVGPRNAAGHPVLGDGRGRPMLLDEALRSLDHPEELDRRLAELPEAARARLHKALSNLLGAALGEEAPR